MEKKLKLGPWNDSGVRWVCEEHPTREQSHIIFNWRRLRFEECGGAGMPELTEENIKKGYVSPPPEINIKK